MKKLILSTLAIAVCCCLVGEVNAAERRRANPEAKQFKYSTTIEKERPELNEETKRLIAAYRKNPIRFEGKLGEIIHKTQAWREYKIVLFQRITNIHH